MAVPLTVLTALVVLRAFRRSARQPTSDCGARRLTTMLDRIDEIRIHRLGR